jgi:hypothetical protein
MRAVSYGTQHGVVTTEGARTSGRFTLALHGFEEVSVSKSRRPRQAGSLPP